jgi:asparaginyl-tRNA synthetase
MDYFRKTKIAQILKQPDRVSDNVIVLGWIRTRRDSANLTFLEVNDGSCLDNLQIVIENPDRFSDIQRARLGSSVRLEGPLVSVPKRKHKIEMHPETLTIIGDCPIEYPLQKKRHSFEFLREIAHLRPRTNTFGVVNRFRSKTAYAVHKFFQERGFYYIHSPIITTTDAEGDGETFRITALDLKKLPFVKDNVDFNQDFFGAETFLTVTGQLEAELLATAIGDVYTFGPTFRAENSNTSRHLSEFWMIEPEMAFCDLFECMELAGEFLKYLFNYALEECREEMEFFNKWIDKDRSKILEGVINSEFIYCTYTEAIEILTGAKKDFEFPVKWGVDLQSEHERYLCEEHFKGPVMVYDYPRRLKPFYMRLNDDGKTVSAVDVLVPQVGEIIGGSQREERLEQLKDQVKFHNIDESSVDWYCDIRRYGTVPHSGFGLGFTRTLMYMSGMGNIRDVIPFPRAPKSAKF